MTYINSARSGQPTITDRFANVLAGMKAAYQRRRTYDQTLRELSALSDRDLSDLGMHRSMISEVARKAAYGK